MQPPAAETAQQELTKECPPEWQKPTRPDPADGGFSACALAFSTLLSSQGPDAHHHQANQPDTGATLLTYLQDPGPSNQPVFPGFSDSGLRPQLADHRHLRRRHPAVRRLVCSYSSALAGLAAP